MLRRYQWWVFGAFCLVTAGILFLRLWTMLPLYLDNDLRTRASVLIQATVAREGWLSSGVSLKQISSEGAVLLYTSHHRGRDLVQCYSLSFTTGQLSSCPQ
ncbi:MAG: hypothetical protein KC680_00145 [Candidatus Peregrinibacteria bacterium]|nr:hypothetical protein [Candidatus Peregrinibacteria bacterium]MCB9808011.1 hypothetical protein [Candidatus Peribacteria bacterium]